METAISLYGYLLITFLGVIVPLFGILLSLFRQGLIELKTQAEREKTNSTKNLREQLKKESEEGQPNLDDIKKSIRELTHSLKTAEKKLSYLNPKKQLLRLFALLFLSFFALLVTMLYKQIAGFALVLSILLFFSALYILWKLLQILVDVKDIIDSRRGELESKVVELLSSTSSTFLKNVYPIIKDRVIKDGEEVTIDLSVDTINEIKIAITNNEKMMAKKVELGLMFAGEFIIEKSPGYTIFAAEDGTQIVRYRVEEIQSETWLRLPELTIKPIKKEVFRVRTFIKAENIKAKDYIVNFNVKSGNPS
jgi:hypothetical protein